MRIHANKEIIFPELSYEIVGIGFEIFNQIGPRHQEKIYQKAFKNLLEENNCVYREQVYCPIRIHDKIIGSYYLDFLIDNKIVVELKVGSKFYKRDFKQIRSYLAENNLRLGLLILFSPKSLRYKRVLHKNISMNLHRN